MPCVYLCVRKMGCAIMAGVAKFGTVPLPFASKQKVKPTKYLTVPCAECTRRSVWPLGGQHICVVPKRAQAPHQTARDTLAAEMSEARLDVPSELQRHGQEAFSRYNSLELDCAMSVVVRRVHCEPAHILPGSSRSHTEPRQCHICVLSNLLQYDLMYVITRRRPRLFPSAAQPDIVRAAQKVISSLPL